MQLKTEHESLPRSEILASSVEHLPAIAALAGVIWRAHYPGIISPEQIEYMLERMYALPVLEEEVTRRGIRYDRLFVASQLAGFAAYGPTDDSAVVKLHKLYLLPELHGRGFGSRLLEHCETAAKQMGARRLILTVNKQNARAIAAYRRNGFVIAEEVVTDIGGGFVMDDYLMAKELVP
jgi:ribosomal protein S18 acetylase RimI-like enzyme